MADILTIEKTVLPSHARRAVHLGVISRAINGEYVVSGGFVQQHAGTPALSVDVDEITYRYGGSEETISGSSTVAIDTADEELPRIDILYITAAGALAVKKGTAEAATADAPGSTAIADWLTWKTPSPPDMSSTPGVILAEVLVAAGKTQILDAYIRMLGQPGVAVTGASGTDGTNGLSVLVLATAPTSGDGEDGQMALDYVAGILYGPKAAGEWPAGTSIIGADGDDGSDGAAGLSVLPLATDPTSSDGEDGQLCINYVTGTLWGPKAAGEWPETGLNLVSDLGVKDAYCTAVGDSALDINEGDANSAFGYHALKNNSNGVYNTAVGSGALAANSTATHNTAVGASALGANTTGIENTAVGAFALATNIGGSNNVAIGKDALNQNTTGNYNIAIGHQAMRLNTSGLSNVAIGHEALEMNTTGQYNAAIGYRALCQNTSGSYNTAVGFQTLTQNTGGSRNVAVGHNTLAANTTGWDNVAVGTSSLGVNTTGSFNVAVGASALAANTIGFGDTAIGYLALATNIGGTQNVSVGAFSLQNNTTGSNNTAIGYQSLQNNVSGMDNVAVGMGALMLHTTGAYNVAVGSNSLLNNLTGASNVAIGYGALMASTSQNNTAIGRSAGSTLTTGSNVACIGYNAQPSGATTTDEIVLGDANIARLRCQVTTITALSDARDKTAIEDLPLGLAFLQSLKPRKFQWHKRIRNGDGSLGERGELGAVDFGFVAQELATALSAHGAEWTDMILSMRDGEVLETTTGKLLPIVVKAIQEMAARIESLEAT